MANFDDDDPSQRNEKGQSSSNTDEVGEPNGNRVRPEDIEPKEPEESDELEQGPIDGSSWELKVRVSRSLFMKLRDKSRQEGLEMSQLAAELLGEGLVKRAWDAGRGGQGQGNHQNYRQDRDRGQRHGRPHDRHNRNNDNRRGVSKDRYHNIMDDKAAFLEYVRGLDKKR